MVGKSRRQRETSRKMVVLLRKREKSMEQQRDAICGSLDFSGKFKLKTYHTSQILKGQFSCEPQYFANSQ